MFRLIFLGGLLIAASTQAPGWSNKATRSGDGVVVRHWTTAAWLLQKDTTALRPQNDTTLVVTYDAISCSCAHWATCPKEKEPSKRKHIYLEPATAELPVAKEWWDGQQLPLRLQVTGHFVSQSGYPKGYVFPKGQPEPAPVFRYRSIKALQPKRGR